MSFAEAFAAEAVVTVDAVVAACRAPASESQDSRAHFCHYYCWCCYRESSFGNAG